MTSFRHLLSLLLAQVGDGGGDDDDDAYDDEVIPHAIMQVMNEHDSNYQKVQVNDEWIKH